MARTRSIASRALITVSGLALALAATTASADTILPGQYRLHNHPDGNVNPPPYGAKFTELLNATAGVDIFTLDFDNIQSAVFLTVNASSTQIHIFGTSWGGRDIGNAYDNDAYLGLYTLDFTYNIGVGGAPGDDDLWVNTAPHSNFGTITAPGGQVINLTDEKSGDYSFRFGDENDDNGHRGFNPGISGWGWMSYVRENGNFDHIPDTDWLFTATFDIPAPGSFALLGLGALGLTRRSRH